MVARNKEEVTIVTGATGGIGRELVRMFSDRGDKVVAACRNIKAAETLFSDMKNVEIMLLDLSCVESIKDFTRNISKNGYVVKQLVNNAGTMQRNFSVTKNGIETTLGVNLVGTYLVSVLMLNSMVYGSRIINTLSVTSNIGRVGSDILDYRGEKYSRMKVYSDSKFALGVVTYYMSEKLKMRGIEVCGVDPGIVDTSMISMGEWYDTLADILFRPFIKRPSVGALPAFVAATTEQSVSGKLFLGRKVKSQCLSKRFINNELALQLTDKMDRLCNLQW